jgi:putative transposase
VLVSARLPDPAARPHRDSHAARRFLRKLPAAEQYVPRVLVTDKPRSYGAAKRPVLPSVEHRRSRYLNNRAENFGPDCGTGDAPVRLTGAGRPVLPRPRPRSTGTSGRRSIQLTAAIHRAILVDRHRIWNEITAALLVERAVA